MASKGALFHLVNEAAPDQTVRTRTRGPANTTRSVAQNKMSQSHVYRFWFERRQPPGVQDPGQVLPCRDGDLPLLLPPGVPAHAVHQRAEAHGLDQGEVQQEKKEEQVAEIKHVIDQSSLFMKKGNYFVITLSVSIH